MTRVIEELGNPFAETSCDLFSIYSKDVADVAVKETITHVKEIGSQMYQKFVSDRLVERKKPINDPIQQSKICLMSKTKIRSTSNLKTKLINLKNDCRLFSRLYIGSQNRDGDLDDFFSHENQPYPPSISLNGGLRLGTKSELLDCLEKVSDSLPAEPKVTALVVDGAALIRILKPGLNTTFKEYANEVLLRQIHRWLQTYDQVDVVWDVYRQSSLKAATRDSRGSGLRRKVTSDALLPKNWSDFLRVNQNKTELFHFLGRSIVRMKLPDGKKVHSTYDENVLCTPEDDDLADLAPCSHEEADTRMIIHCLAASKKGHERIMIRTVDTDVVVLATANFTLLGLRELWVGFGTGSRYRFLPIHEYANALGPSKCVALPIFHALTGCDTVSSFLGRGKKTAWKVWEAFDQITPTFKSFSKLPNEINRKCQDDVERFVILLYDRTSGLSQV